MSISKKVFTTALALMVATSISSAKAEDATEKDNAVLFKIHDITPVKNSEGEVVACDFNTTFYNRSPFLLREASMELSWHDTSLENVINDEKKAEAAKNGSGVRGYSETERSSEQDVKVMIDVPTIKSYKQTTLKNRVNTDRCFLLVGNVEYTMRNCSSESQVTDNRRRRSTVNSECARLFQFVSPEDAQYYQEFKEVSVEEQDTQAENKRKEEKSELDKLYSATVETIGSTGSIVSGIK